MQVSLNSFSYSTVAAALRTESRRFWISSQLHRIPIARLSTGLLFAQAFHWQFAFCRGRASIGRGLPVSQPALTT